MYIIYTIAQSVSPRSLITALPSWNVQRFNNTFDEEGGVRC